MTFADIRSFPTAVDFGGSTTKVHESCLRSFQIVGKLEELIAAGAPSKVLLEIIEDLRGAPQADFKPRGSM